MTQSINPHDKFFKELLSRRENAIDFLQHYLPPNLAGSLDYSTLSLVKDSFVDTRLREHFSDLLYQISFKEQSQLFIYILFEHKSSPAMETAFQLLRYMVRIWEYARRQQMGLFPIFPLVLYHGQSRWTTGRELQDFIQCPPELSSYFPNFKYELCDLSQYSDAEIKGEVILRVGLLLFKYIFREELAEKLPDILQLLSRLVHQRTGLEYLESLLIYASSKLNDQEIHQAVTTAMSAEGEEIMSTIADRWFEQGILQGIEQGIEKGIEKGIEQGIEKGIEQGIEKGIEQGIARGLRQGLMEAIELDLEIKFGVSALKEIIQIRKIEDVSLLRTIRKVLRSVDSVEELRAIYQDYFSHKEH